MEEDILIEDPEIEVPLEDEEDVVTDEPAPEEPSEEEEQEESEIDPAVALEIAKQKYPNLFKESESDWESEMIDKAVRVAQETQGLQADVMRVALSRMGDYKSDPEAVEYMRQQVMVTPPAVLKQALEQPALLDSAFYQFVGWKSVQTPKVKAKNVSVAPSPTQTGRTITIQTEDKDEYRKMEMIARDLPADRAKKFKENWLKQRGYK